MSLKMRAFLGTAAHLCKVVVPTPKQVAEKESSLLTTYLNPLFQVALHLPSTHYSSYYHQRYYQVADVVNLRVYEP